jgi:prevent-host-death family protein
MATYRVSATHAVRQFSELLRRSGDGGQEILIERNNKPVARLSPAGLSPVTWSDVDRQLRRIRSPDTRFFDDLLAARGSQRAAPTRVAPRPYSEGTLLLDAPFLVQVRLHLHRFERRQRVATTAAAIAELTAVAGSRGAHIELGRREHIARVAAALPVLSLNHLAALSVVGGGASASSLFRHLALATAESLEWALAEYVWVKEKPPGLPGGFP